MRFYLLFSFFICISCSSGFKYEITDLTITKTLNKTIKTKQIVEGCYSDCFLNDSLLILIATCDSNCFHIFDKKTLEYRMKFGLKGEGPNDFHFPKPYRKDKPNTPKGVMNLYDVNSGYNKRIDFSCILNGNKTEECIEATPMDVALIPCFEINYLGNNEIAMRSTQEGKGQFMIYNENTEQKKWTDFIPPYNMDNDALQIMAYYGLLHCNPEKNRIVYASRYFDEIVFYDFEGNYVNGLFFSALNKPLTKNINDNLVISTDAKLYTVLAHATEDYIYLFRANQPASQLRSELKLPLNMLIVDWNGLLVDVYNLDFHPGAYCVDEEKRLMYMVIRNNEIEEFHSEIRVFQL